MWEDWLEISWGDCKRGVSTHNSLWAMILRLPKSDSCDVL